MGGEGGAESSEQFTPEADLSFLEGETIQSPTKALGKRDIVYVLFPKPRVCYRVSNRADFSKQ